MNVVCAPHYICGKYFNGMATLLQINQGRFFSAYDDRLYRFFLTILRIEGVYEEIFLLPCLVFVLFS